MAGSLTDIFAAMQNGVVALGNFKQQLTGSFNNISAQLATKAPSSAVLASSTAFVTTIAGNSSAFTLNGASGITNSTNDILLSQASSSQFGAVKVNATTITASAGIISLTVSPITASTSVDVALNNTGTYFDGPSVAQGSSGTWCATGSVVVQDTAGTAQIQCKLWDGTTIIASGDVTTPAANAVATVTLSGFLAAPAGNLRISSKDVTSVNGKILFNQTGNSRDSTITAIRIA